MSHRCQIQGSSAACFEENNELWVKEYADGRQTEGRTYRVKFCPECGFEILKVGPFKGFIGRFNIPDYAPDDTIIQFSQTLSSAIAQMNRNIESIKAYMILQNSQNECFMQRDLAKSEEISCLKRRLQILEEK
jgi:hypothetical protein